MTDEKREHQAACPFEIDILREVAGEVPSRPWGAAVGAALGWLRGNGYMDSQGITMKGQELLAKHLPEDT